MQIRMFRVLLAAVLIWGCNKAEESRAPSVAPPTTTVVETRDQALAPPDAAAAATPPPAPVDAGVAVAALPDAGAAAPVAPDAGAAPVKIAGDVDLTSAGAEPRYLLRYAIPAGTKQRMQMVADVHTDTPMGKISMPTMKMLFDMEVTEVADDGDLTIRLILADVKLEEKADTMPGVIEQIEQTLPDVKGTSTILTLDATGKLLDIKADQTTADPVLGQALGRDTVSQLYIQLPQVAVGKGARWRSKGKGNHNGIAINYTTTSEVVAVTATSVKVKVTISLKAASQTVEQMGMKVDVKKFSGKNTTTVALDLTKLVPTTTGKATTSMTLAAQGQEFEMGSTTELKIKPR